MQKRILLCILMIAIFINVGGCTSTQSAAPKTEIQHTATQPMENFSDAVGKGNKADTNKLEDMQDLEMKHWKYNRDQQAVREASQQSQQQKQSTVESADQNVSDANARKGTGQGNYYNNPGSYTPIRIDFLTEDDFNKALNQLTKLGYLDATSPNEQSFKAALSEFQKNQGLKASGQLDAETINSLDTQANQ